jgi:hypothetical protein
MPRLLPYHQFVTRKYRTGVRIKSPVSRFEIPESFDGVDLSAGQPVIDWTNAAGTADKLELTPVAGDGVIYATWILDSNATAVNGPVRFTLSMILADETYGKQTARYLKSKRQQLLTDATGCDANHHRTADRRRTGAQRGC